MRLLTCSIFLLACWGALAAAQEALLPWPPARDNHWVRRYGKWGLSCEYSKITERADCYLWQRFPDGRQFLSFEVRPGIGVTIGSFDDTNAAAVKVGAAKPIATTRCIGHRCYFDKAQSSAILDALAGSVPVSAIVATAQGERDQILDTSTFAEAMAQMLNDLGPIVFPEKLPPDLPSDMTDPLRRGRKRS